MRRALTLAVLAAISLFALGGVAQAQTARARPDVAAGVPPPAPAPVTDVATAEAFAEGYAARNASRFLAAPRNVRTIDAKPRCLAHPVIADRYGCVFTLRALVIQRGRLVARPPTPRPARPSASPRSGSARYGCLGALTVVGGAAPQGIVRFVECSRVPRGDLVAPEPVA